MQDAGSAGLAGDADPVPSDLRRIEDPEGGSASPDELRRAIRDVSGVFHDRRLRHDTDAAAAAIPTRGTRLPEPASPDPGEAADPEFAPLPPVPWAPKPPVRARLPDLILIDGGRGQLNAAVAELAKLGLEGIPVIGLAKEFEEIHRPGEKEPLRLGLDSPAVKLLQRVRDEAHRFANTFNAQLRLKKISESLLDEFPGIGEARKQALLKRFGSVQRLKLATPEQIAEVPGFGGAMAARLREFLSARSVPTEPADRT